jgi:hypothetical protein
MNEVAATHPRYGYGGSGLCSGPRARRVNRKRIEGLWRLEGAPRAA